MKRPPLLSTSAADVAQTVSRSFSGASVEAKTERGVAHGVARRVTRSALLQILVSFGVVGLTWRASHATGLLVWAVLASLVGVLRAADIVRRQRQPDYLEDPRRDTAAIAFGAMLSGVLLAVAYLLFVIDADIPRQLAFTLVVVGACSGAVASMAGQSLPYLAYALPPMMVVGVGLIAAGAQAGSGVAFVAGFLVLVYQVGLWLLFVSLGHQLRDALRLQFLNERLVDELESRNQVLEEERDELRVVALTDELTDLPNRRYFENVVSRDWARCRREQKAIACVLVELDRIDEVNVRLGHTVGDLRLQALAHRLKLECRRSTDFVARYRSATFAMVLPSTDLDGALHFAELLMNGLMPSEGSTSGRERLPVSMGIGAANPPDSDDWRRILRDATEALDRARQAGGGRIETTVHSGYTTTATSVA